MYDNLLRKQSLFYKLHREKTTILLYAMVLGKYSFYLLIKRRILNPVLKSSQAQNRREKSSFFLLLLKVASNRKEEEKRLFTKESFSALFSFVKEEKSLKVFVCIKDRGFCFHIAWFIIKLLWPGKSGILSNNRWNKSAWSTFFYKVCLSFSCNHFKYQQKVS